MYQLAQVIEVARQSIHTVHHHGVALAHEGQQPFKFGTLRVFARSLIGKYLSNFDLIQLSIRVLVVAADADIPDALTLQSVSKYKSVSMKSMTFSEMCQ